MSGVGEECFLHTFSHATQPFPVLNLYVREAPLSSSFYLKPLSLHGTCFNQGRVVQSWV